MQQSKAGLTRGIVAGVLAAGVLAAWFLGVDLIRGQPFDAPIFLASALVGLNNPQATIGLLLLYTVLHFFVFIIIGIAVAWLFDRSGVAPHPLLGLVLGFLMFDLMFYTGVVVTGVDVVQALGWPEVLVGNLLAGMTVVGYLHMGMPGVRYSVSAMLGQNRVVREGLFAGLIGATAVMAWFLLIDGVRGQLFFTPAALAGGIFDGVRAAADVTVSPSAVIGYTALHVAAFLGVGFVAAALAVAAEDEPVILLGIVLLFATTEALFIGLLAIVASWLVDALSWWAIIAGNVIAAISMGFFLWRSHPVLRRHLDEEVEESLAHAGEL